MCNPNAALRLRLAREAAKLLRAEPSLSIPEARTAAIARLSPSRVRAADLPTDEEISRQLQSAAPVRQAPVDRYAHYEFLLQPLEDVKQHATYHPEGDALYHSLQVFEHARDQEPYDAEFLAAALLHDVGKAIDPRDHVASGLAALEGFIAERTAWLIEHHMLCHDLHEGTMGQRTKRRLQQSPWFPDLVALGECDRAGRQPGVETIDTAEAVGYLRMIQG